MKLNHFFLTLFFSSLFLTSNAQGNDIIFQKLDTIVFHRYIETFKSKKQSQVGDLMVQTGVFLMDSPYVPKTLEVCGNNERLVVNLRQFDCETFVESCIALVHTLKSRNQNFSDYCAELKSIRYRNGEITDFSSRLHYFTEWISNNSTKGKVINLTAGFGGKQFYETFDFMSRKPELYPQMSNPEVRSEIKEIEKNISGRMNFYIPKTTPANSKIRNGDILCFTSKAPGIAIAHVGIAFRLDNVLYLLHASQSDKKVEISSEPFDEYLAHHSNFTGYMVVRPL